MKHLLLSLFCFSISISFAQNTAQERAEETIKNHLTSVFTQERYKSFGFEALYKVSPPEIAEIDELKANVDVLRRKNLLTDSSLKHYDSVINVKVKAVKAKKLFSTYDINHYFVVNEKGGKNILYYYHFELYPDGKIKDVEQLMKLPFVNIEYDWFYSYYRRNSLYTNDEKENEISYAYMDNIISNYTKNRESAMATVLATHGVIARYAYLDTVKLPRIIVQNWLVRNNPESIKITNYSEVTPLFDGTEKIGYKLFCEYSINEEKKAHYFEFDLNFVMLGNLIVQPPYEEYFKRK